jgi:hypothetical protein
MINSPTLCHPLAQAFWPDIRPVLLYVVKAGGAVCCTENHPPSGRHLDKGRPQAVLLLVVDQNEKAAIVVIKWIDTQRFSRHHPRTISGTCSKTNREIATSACFQRNHRYLLLASSGLNVPPDIAEHVSARRSELAASRDQTGREQLDARATAQMRPVVS